MGSFFFSTIYGTLFVLAQISALQKRQKIL